MCISIIKGVTALFFIILKSDLEQMYSLKSVGGMSADTAAVSCTALFRILSRLSEHFHAVPEQ